MPVAARVLKLCSVGHVELEAGNHAAARIAYSDALLLLPKPTPTRASVLLNRATCLQHLGSAALALADATAIISQATADPNSVSEYTWVAARCLKRTIDGQVEPVPTSDEASLRLTVPVDYAVYQLLNKGTTAGFAPAATKPKPSKKTGGKPPQPLKQQETPATPQPKPGGKGSEDPPSESSGKPRSDPTTAADSAGYSFEAGELPLDAINRLMNAGRLEEAIELCDQLNEDVIYNSVAATASADTPGSSMDTVSTAAVVQVLVAKGSAEAYSGRYELSLKVFDRVLRVVDISHAVVERLEGPLDSLGSNTSSNMFDRTRPEDSASPRAGDSAEGADRGERGPPSPGTALQGMLSTSASLKSRTSASGSDASTVSVLARQVMAGAGGPKKDRVKEEADATKWQYIRVDVQRRRAQVLNHMDRLDDLTLALRDAWQCLDRLDLLVMRDDALKKNLMLKKDVSSELTAAFAALKMRQKSRTWAAIAVRTAERLANRSPPATGGGHTKADARQLSTCLKALGTAQVAVGDCWEAIGSFTRAIDQLWLAFADSADGRVSPSVPMSTSWHAFYEALALACEDAANDFASDNRTSSSCSYSDSNASLPPNASLRKKKQAHRIAHLTPQQLVQLKSGLSDMLTLRAQAYREVGRAKEALLDVNGSITLWKAPSQRYYLRGYIHYLTGDMAACIADNRVCLQSDAQCNDAYLLIAAAQHNAGDFVSSINTYAKALKVACKRMEKHQTGSDQGSCSGTSSNDTAHEKETHDTLWQNDVFAVLLMIQALWLQHHADTMAWKGFSFDQAYTPAFKEALAKRDLTAFGKSPVNVAQTVKYVKGAMAAADYRVDEDPSSSIDSAFGRESSDFGRGGKPKDSGRFDAFFRTFYAFSWPFSERPPGSAKLPLSAKDPGVKALVLAADKLGEHVQYYCDGFFRNSRHHRAAGYAMLEVSEFIRGLLGGTSPSVGSKSNGLTCPWKALFSSAVKWRQVVDQRDTVYWIDGLSEESLREGFGVQTPMIIGEQKVVKYHQYHDRCLALLKEAVVDQCILTDEQHEAVIAASTAVGVWNAVGRDVFGIMHCDEILEGTRLTAHKTPSGEVVLAIRTAGTLQRCAAYSGVLQGAVDKYLNLLREHFVRMNHDAANSKRIQITHPDTRLLTAILRIFYYWANFQALTRGSSFVGLTVLQGLLLPLGSLVRIPTGVQLDWEAILTPTAHAFVSKQLSWMQDGFEEVTRKLQTTSLPSLSANVRSVGDAILLLKGFELN
ncbi:Suppressor of RPS4-RLD 1 [Diplonema papillatum]|nr:Suppressor of RPS4-RLD 1 [Diplonema papillatum]